MNQLQKGKGLALLAAAAFVAGCGGGVDQGGSSAAPPAARSDLPSSALQSPEGLAAFQKSLNRAGDDTTGAPLVLGEAVLPTSDTAEPLAVN